MQRYGHEKKAELNAPHPNSEVLGKPCKKNIGTTQLTPKT